MWGSKERTFRNPFAALFPKKPSPLFSPPFLIMEPDTSTKIVDEWTNDTSGEKFRTLAWAEDEGIGLQVEMAVGGEWVPVENAGDTVHTRPKLTEKRLSLVEILAAIKNKRLELRETIAEEFPNIVWAEELQENQDALDAFVEQQGRGYDLLKWT